MLEEKLNKQMLEDWGIKEITQIDDGVWEIKRVWPQTNSKKLVEKTIQVSQAPRYHIYSPTYYRPIVSFSVKRSQKIITLNRLLYAWFIGEVPEGLCVGPDYDNPGHLKLKTYKEAQRDRYLVNSEIKNQWYYIYGRK